MKGCVRLALLAASGAAALGEYVHSEGKLNVLLVIFDDMRPETGSYGSQNVVTPNFDRFANEGVQFQNAYATQAICGPSRASIMTAKTPSKLEYFENESPTQEMDLLNNNFLLTRHFQNQGYKVKGTSKIAHWVQNNANIMDEYYKLPSANANDCGENVVCSPNDEATDAMALKWAKTKVTEMESSKDPSFVIVGFRRPHLVWSVPRDVLDTFDVAKVSGPESPEFPTDAPWLAHRPMCTGLANSLEVRETGFAKNDEKALETQTAKALRRGYFASISWVDKLFGELLDHVEASGVKNNTLIIATSDHGWQLGEHASWCKGSLYDQAARVPLIIRDPKGQRAPGTKENYIVSLLDYFPTIAELANIPLTYSQYSDHGLQGRSFAHLLRPHSKPTASMEDYFKYTPQTSGATWSYPSSSAGLIWPICVESPGSTTQVQCRTCKNKKGVEQPCEECPANICSREVRDPDYMGFSIRTTNYRYSEWRKWQDNEKGADWSSEGLVGAQLYHHEAEGPELETVNLVDVETTVRDNHIKFLRARFVECVADSSAACTALGNHCNFIQGFGCTSKAFCDFRAGSLSTRKNQCAAQGEACAWDTDSGSCINKSSEGRPLEISGETLACEEVTDPDYCRSIGCTVFKGYGCRPKLFCDFKTKLDYPEAVGCLTNSEYCRWWYGKCILLKKHRKQS